jgi:hypothetical protein
VRLRIEEKNGTCGMNTYPSWTSVVWFHLKIVLWKNMSVLLSNYTI